MIFYILLTALIICNIVCVVVMNNQHEDLKDYEAIIESTMENNNKLIKINENMMRTSDELRDLINHQNKLTDSVINDNIELTARLNEVLLHIDDGK